MTFNFKFGNLLPCFVCLALWAAVPARASVTDSMLAVIQKMPDDTNKIKALFNLGGPLEDRDSAACQKVYTIAMALSEKLHDTVFMAKACTNNGVLQRRTRHYDAAIQWYQKAFDLSKRINNNRGMGRALSNIANIYGDQRDYQAATNTLLEAIPYMEKANDQKGLALTYSNVGNIFSEQRLFPKAIEYGKKAVEAGLLSMDSMAIGATYANLSASYLYIYDMENAFKCSANAINYLRHSTSYGNLHSSYQNMASYYGGINDYTNATLYTDSSLAIARIMQQPRTIASALILKSGIAREQGKLELATQYMTEAKQYVTADGSWKVIEQWNQNMSWLSKAKGDYKSALEYNVQAGVYYDSSNNLYIQNNNMALEAQYQAGKKQAQIETLEKEKHIQQLAIRQRNILLLILLGTLVAIGTIAFLFYKNSQRQKLLLQQAQVIQKQQIKELEQDKQLQATNALLQGEEQERSRLARDLHDGLGGILSSVKFSFNNIRDNIVLNAQQAESFSNSVSKLDDSISELRRIAQNMMPENLYQFGLNASLRDLCNSVSVDGKIHAIYQPFGMDQYVANASIDLAVYRIAQEVLHNAIKHSEGTQAILQLSFADSKLLFAAEDNGKGFDTALLKDGKGSGFRSIQNRVQFLNGQIHIVSSHQGTSITIEIPT